MSILYSHVKLVPRMLLAFLLHTFYSYLLGANGFLFNASMRSPETLWAKWEEWFMLCFVSQPFIRENKHLSWLSVSSTYWRPSDEKRVCEVNVCVMHIFLSHSLSLYISYSFVCLYVPAVANEDKTRRMNATTSVYFSIYNCSWKVLRNW